MLHVPDNEKKFISARLWNKIKIGDPDECWPWQGAMDNKGRGRLNLKGKVVTAPQVLLVLEGKPKPPAPNDCALHKHSCEPSCMNPSHLRWGSQKENMQDRMIAGTSRHKPGSFIGSKSSLTEQDIRDIRNSCMTLDELGELYEVSSRAIWDIKKRKSWQWVEEV